MLDDIEAKGHPSEKLLSALKALGYPEQDIEKAQGGTLDEARILFRAKDVALVKKFPVGSKIKTDRYEGVIVDYLKNFEYGGTYEIQLRCHDRIRTISIYDLAGAELLENEDIDPKDLTLKNLREQITRIAKKYLSTIPRPVDIASDVPKATQAIIVLMKKKKIFKIENKEGFSDETVLELVKEWAETKFNYTE